MRAIHHIAAKGEAAERVFHHIVYCVQPWVGTLESGALPGIDGTNLQCTDSHNTGTFDTHIAESMHVESVLENILPLAIRDVHVSLSERWLGLSMVEIFHRHRCASLHRGENGIEPARHHTPEVNDQTAVRLLLAGQKFQRVNNAVALELLPPNRSFKEISGVVWRNDSIANLHRNP